MNLLSKILYNSLMDLNSLIIIEKIAKLGSFSAAASALKMPNSNLSLKVKKLEEELGQPLFTRSTRKVVITEFGQKVRAIAASLTKIEEEVKALAEEAITEPSGNIRVTAPYDIGLYLLREVIPPFIAKHPKVKIQVEVSNQYVNIIEGGFDFAIRASRKMLEDSTTVAVKLGETSFHFFAPKKSQYTEISNLKELEKQPILSYSGNEIKITNGSISQLLKVESKVLVNDMAGIKQAVIGGAGIGILPEFICSDRQSRKDLIKIFPEWSAGQASFYAILAGKTSLTCKNRAFLEFLKSHFHQ
ncbi:MAG: LysR family transcriptional regulator [Bdellovibrionota bacterium]